MMADMTNNQPAPALLWLAVLMNIVLAIALCLLPLLLLLAAVLLHTPTEWAEQ